MADELNESAPTDDIRSALAAAIASHETPAEPAPKPEKSDDAVVAGDPPAAEVAETETKAERQRGPDGKFVKAETEAKDEAAKEPKPATEKAEAAETPEKPAPAGKDAPANWAASDKEMFKTLSDPAKQFLLKRHTQMEADYTKKTQAIAELKREYEPVDQMFTPYRQIMQQRGFTPASLIRAWANVEQRLVGGEDSAIQVVKGLIDGYKIPVVKLAGALGIRSGVPPQPAADGQPPPVDPAQPVPTLPPELLTRLDGIEREIANRRNAEAAQAQAARTAAEQRVTSQIEEFKSKTDASGNLLHPHFEEVEADMTTLAQIANAKQQPVPSLEQLYETAVWANPSTRARLQAQQDERRTAEAQAAEKKRAEEARAKAAAARKAGSSVTGAPGSGQAPAGRRSSDLSLREQLEEAAAEHAA